MPADSAIFQFHRTGATVLALAVTLLAGCTTTQHAADPTDLSSRLAGLSHTVEPEEAERVAETACNYSMQLAQEYHVVRPAVLQNLLVFYGIKKRGLCYQWADDIAVKLQSLPLRTLQLHFVVARPGQLREHNALALTAVGQSFEEGILLDAWRHSGRLYWTVVKEDKYPWIEAETFEPAERQFQTFSSGTH
jgi:hypothetical protein